MDSETEIKRKTIREIVKKIEVRIKAAQDNSTKAYHTEDAWCYDAVARELIDLKIQLEKYRKFLKTDK